MVLQKSPSNKNGEKWQQPDETTMESFPVDLERKHGVNNVAIETVEVLLHIAEHPCGQTAISSLFHGNSFDTGAGKIKWSVYENGMIVSFVLVHVNLIAKIHD